MAESIAVFYIYREVFEKRRAEVEDAVRRVADHLGVSAPEVKSPDRPIEFVNVMQERLRVAVAEAIPQYAHEALVYFPD